MELEERGEGKKRERGMLFYAESRGGLTALATTSVVNAGRAIEAAAVGVGSLNGSIRTERERKGDHVIGLQLITSLRCFPPGSNRGGRERGPNG